MYSGYLKAERGFTLIELMVVALILAIIIAIAIPIYISFQKEAATQEAYLQLSVWSEVIVGKALKGKETGVTQVAIPEDPVDGKYFNYSAIPSGTWSYDTEDIQLVATGRAGTAVEGNVLYMNIKLDGNVPVKLINGELY
jgi:type IV pilus assembly protein PilA